MCIFSIYMEQYPPNCSEHYFYHLMYLRDLIIGTPSVPSSDSLELLHNIPLYGWCHTLLCQVLVNMHEVFLFNCFSNSDVPLLLHIFEHSAKDVYILNIYGYCSPKTNFFKLDTPPKCWNVPDSLSNFSSFCQQKKNFVSLLWIIFFWLCVKVMIVLNLQAFRGLAASSLLLCLALFLFGGCVFFIGLYKVFSLLLRPSLSLHLK